MTWCLVTPCGSLANLFDVTATSLCQFKTEWVCESVCCKEVNICTAEGTEHLSKYSWIKLCPI